MERENWVKIELEKDVDAGTLEELYSKLPEKSFFQTPIWLNSLAKSFDDFEAFWLVLHEGGTVRALMPFIRAKRFVFHTNWSMPFGTYGGALADSRDDEKRLIDEFFKISSTPLCLRAHVLLFKSTMGYDPPSGVRLGVEECHLIDLSMGFEHYWDVMIRKKRRQLYRKAMRQGVAVRELSSVWELDEFYSIYNENSKVWGGVHPYPRVLFDELFEKGGDKVVFLGGFLGKRLIAGHILFFSDEMVQAWQAAVADEAYRYYMSEVLVVEAVREACRRGIKLFNLGSSGGNRGIEEFKESMGGERFKYVVLKMDRF